MKQKNLFDFLKWVFAELRRPKMDCRLQKLTLKNVWLPRAREGRSGSRRWPAHGLILQDPWEDQRQDDRNKTQKDYANERERVVVVVAAAIVVFEVVVVGGGVAAVTIVVVAAAVGTDLVFVVVLAAVVGFDQCLSAKSWLGGECYESN